MANCYRNEDEIEIEEDGNESMISRQDEGDMDTGSITTDDGADARSIWVGNVDYGSTAGELEAHFASCGAILRISILCNKFTGQPKGFAYIEFESKSSVESAIAFNGSLFCGRTLQVLPKRTNLPGISTTNRPPFRPKMQKPSKGRFNPGSAPRGSAFRPRLPDFRYKAARFQYPQAPY